MIHAHNLLVCHPSLYSSRCYLNHVEAWFKQNNKTNVEANFKSFCFVFDSTRRYIFNGCFVFFNSCVCVCAIGCLESGDLKAPYYRHDRKEM